MSIKIIETLKGNETMAYTLFSTIYVKDIGVCFHNYSDSFHITHLHNALVRGKKCDEFVFIKQWTKVERNQRCLNFAVDILNYNDSDLTFNEFLINPDKVKFNDEVLTKNIRELDSKDVFTPFGKIPKAVNIEKTKLNLGDIKKMLLNGQISKVITRQETTDDYAADAAANFSKDRTIDKMDICKTLIESPSGWYVLIGGKDDNGIRKDDNGNLYIDIACHYFRYERCYLS